jgi:hypothetical protein
LTQTRQKRPAREPVVTAAKAVFAALPMAPVGQLDVMDATVLAALAGAAAGRVLQVLVGCKGLRGQVQESGVGQPPPRVAPAVQGPRMWTTRRPPTWATTLDHVAPMAMPWVVVGAPGAAAPIVPHPTRCSPLPVARGPGLCPEALLTPFDVPEMVPAAAPRRVTDQARAVEGGFTPTCCCSTGRDGRGMVVVVDDPSAQPAPSPPWTLKRTGAEVTIRSWALL